MQTKGEKHHCLGSTCLPVSFLFTANAKGSFYDIMLSEFQVWNVKRSASCAKVRSNCLTQSEN